MLEASQQDFTAGRAHPRADASTQAVIKSQFASASHPAAIGVGVIVWLVSLMVVPWVGIQIGIIKNAMHIVYALIVACALFGILFLAIHRYKRKRLLAHRMWLSDQHERKLDRTKRQIEAAKTRGDFERFGKK